VLGLATGGCRSPYSPCLFSGAVILKTQSRRESFGDIRHFPAFASNSFPANKLIGI
jgi:hypothetical protein